METTFEKTIKTYLDDRAKSDSLFAKTYRKANKSIKECCQYICSQARKLAKDANSIGIDDATVYGWAVHYYDEDDIKTEEVEENVEVVSAPPAPAVAKEKPIRQKVDKKTAKVMFDERQLSLFEM